MPFFDFSTTTHVHTQIPTHISTCLHILGWRTSLWTTTQYYQRASDIFLVSLYYSSTFVVLNLNIIFWELSDYVLLLLVLLQMLVVVMEGGVAGSKIFFRYSLNDLATHLNSRFTIHASLSNNTYKWNYEITQRPEYTISDFHLFRSMNYKLFLHWLHQLIEIVQFVQICLIFRSVIC